MLRWFGTLFGANSRLGQKGLKSHVASSRQLCFSLSSHRGKGTAAGDTLCPRRLARNSARGSIACKSRRLSWLGGKRSRGSWGACPVREDVLETPGSRSWLGSAHNGLLQVPCFGFSGGREVVKAVQLMPVAKVLLILGLAQPLPGVSSHAIALRAGRPCSRSRERAGERPNVDSIVGIVATELSQRLRRDMLRLRLRRPSGKEGEMSPSGLSAGAIRHASSLAFDGRLRPKRRLRSICVGPRGRPVKRARS